MYDRYFCSGICCWHSTDNPTLFGDILIRFVSLSGEPYYSYFLLSVNIA